MTLIDVVVSQHTSQAGKQRVRSRNVNTAAKRRESRFGLLFSMPWLIGFTAFFGLPILASAFFSFTDFNIFQSPSMVGWANYGALFQDEKFYKALFNTFFIVGIGVPLDLVLALGLALLLNLNIKGQPLYRAVIYLPTIIPTIVTVYIWRYLLNAQYGFINQGLSLFGFAKPLWLTDPDWTKPSVILIGFWTIGATAVIYLAALQDVPQELKDAARVDGAGPIRRFWAITWPTISPITLFQVVVLLIGRLQIFAQPYLLSQAGYNNVSSGPDDSLLTYAMYVYQNAFVFLKMGYASALAWILFIVIMIVTLLLLLSSKSWVHYGN